jgi:hypothetical protein
VKGETVPDNREAAGKGRLDPALACVAGSRRVTSSLIQGLLTFGTPAACETGPAPVRLEANIVPNAAKLGNPREKISAD